MCWDQCLPLFFLDGSQSRRGHHGSWLSLLIPLLLTCQGCRKKIKRILFPAFITDSERGNVVGRSLTPDLCSQGLLPWIHSRTAKTLQIWVRSLIGCPDNRETSLCYVGGPDFHLVSSCQQTDHWPKRKSERAEASEKFDGNCCLEDVNVHVSGKRKHWLHSTENQ